MDLLRHGGMGRLFTGIRAPSTLGTFLRTFTFGHVRQLDAVASRFLISLAKNTPILPGAGQTCYRDIDDTIKATHGYAKQGAGYGYTGVKGLNALIAIVSTPTSAPVIAATRLRKGRTNSARGAARIVADALATAKACGGRGLVTVRADSAYYGHDVIAVARRGRARFSVTVPMNPAVLSAISGIAESAWTVARLEPEHRGVVGLRPLTQDVDGTAAGYEVAYHQSDHRCRGQSQPSVAPGVGRSPGGRPSRCGPGRS